MCENHQQVVFLTPQLFSRERRELELTRCTKRLLTSEMRGASTNKYPVTCYPATVNSHLTAAVNKQTTNKTNTQVKGNVQGLHTAPLVETQPTT